MEKPVVAAKFFRHSRPLPREDFFATYVQAVRVVQLCMCPFGSDGPALRAATELLGEEGAVEEYSLLFREWEDLVSKRLFELRGVGDDRVASSIHQFIELDRDAEIIENIRETAGLVARMVRCPDVVDLTLSAGPGAASCCAHSVDASTAQVAAQLLDQVLRSCKFLLLDDAEGVEGGLDQEVFQHTHIAVSTRLVLPSELERRAKAAGSSGLSNDALRALLSALTLSLPSSAHGCHGGGGEVSVDVTVEQYYTLLAIHGEAEPVRAVIAAHFPGNRSVTDVRSLQALCVRGGAAAHPLFSLHARLAQREELDKDAYFLRRAMKLRKEAVDSAGLGDTQAALLLVQAAGESSDIADEDAATDLGLEPVDARYRGKPCVLPVYLRAQLLVLRAELHLSQGEAEQCCACCDAAIALDARHGPAHGLRGRALQERGQLSAAVLDSLKAFLLGGSTDLALAAQAEDAAREAERAFAKDIYRQRREQLEAEGDASTLFTDESFLPKSWLVRSFLAGYDLASLALGVDPLFAQEAAAGEVDALFGTAEPPAAPGRAMVDIDEQAAARDLLPPPPELLDERPPEGCWEDPYGYLLLRRLVGLLDSPAMHLVDCTAQRSSSSASDACSHGSLPAPLLECSSPAARDEWALASLLFVDGSPGHVRQAGAGSPSSSIAPDAEDSAACAQQLEQLLLCSGHGAGGPAALEPCAEFVSALRLLRLPLSAALSGVRFSRNGLVRAVRPSSNDCAEGDWEDCDGDDEGEEPQEEEGGVEGEGAVLGGGLSRPLRARLLNICSTVAYLAGDAAGAVQCLRESAAEDPELLDSRLKLGSLLVDMDEGEEAEALLAGARERDGNNPFVDLHAAELSIHRSDFEQALRQLRAARRNLAAAEEARGSSPWAPLSSVGRGAAAISPGNSELMSRLTRLARDRLRANVCALLGVAQFRAEPSKPEYALTVLQDGVERHPHSIYLLLCLGEVQSQAGDMVSALKTFKRATRSEADHPFPFVNAARTYQQLGQPRRAYQHLLHAISSDPAVAMARVDLALNLLQQGKAADALTVLDVALRLARHVSEIHDVCTAAALARLQLELKSSGVA